MIKPVYDENGVTLYHSHSLFVMMSMPDNSVDSIVTDPPYGLSFMGKKWDYDVPSVQLWAEALRVLKPGGHLLAFAGSRTYHRMAINIEDAGFTIRDQIMWIYGSGFPKSLDISKAIDKAAGVKRTDTEWVDRYHDGGTRKTQTEGSADISFGCNANTNIKSIPATPAAIKWEGWGTALKPAHEPIVVARKPLIGTVAENVLKHGTGGINIDGGRIGTNEDCKRNKYMVHDTPAGFHKGRMSGGNGHDKGRFPANIIFDPEAAAMLDAQSGPSSPSSYRPPDEGGTGNSLVFKHDHGEHRGHNDSGGASRFFYCAKASKQDRDEGLEGMPKIEMKMPGKATGFTPETGEVTDGYLGLRRNIHPTVKPTELMQYLVRLVTPKGGVTFDPFMGSGSTGKAAVREGFKFIGCEREAEYIPIAIARINAPAQVTLL